jgi:gas vesicle protein
MKSSTFFAFLGGAVLGATVALLLAPDKGSNTRREIRRRLKNIGIHLSKDELKEVINRFKKQEKETADATV